MTEKNCSLPDASSYPAEASAKTPRSSSMFRSRLIVSIRVHIPTFTITLRQTFDEQLSLTLVI